MLRSGDLGTAAVHRRRFVVVLRCDRPLACGVLAQPFGSRATRHHRMRPLPPMLAETLPDRQLADAEHLALAGGDLHGIDLQREMASGRRARLINAYGPTEDDGLRDRPPVNRDLQDESPSLRLVVRYGTRGFTFWTGAWSLYRPGLRGALHCGRGPGAGLSGACGADGGAVCCRPVWSWGSRMYRTGDLARWRADGVLEFLGRADQPGEAARLPDRAWRDRGGAGAACGGGAGGGDRARGCARRQAAGGLCGGGGGRGLPMRRRCGRILARAFRTTWCRRRLWCWSGFR